MKYQGWLQDGRIVSVERKSIFIFNKHVYEGELVDGCAHGSGVMLWPDGRWYDGEWNGGSPHGEGTLCMPDGDKKTGYFEPCNARWYAPLKVNKAFWPGQLDESEMLRVDKKLPPAQDRMSDEGGGMTGQMDAMLGVRSGCVREDARDGAEGYGTSLAPQGVEVQRWDEAGDHRMRLKVMG
eukprot:CAMPEP_0173459602 /NCGR_PEP_ID=MMETSP1357-20121228/61689_1 /TAXON_ID=77926 /ORGANISM="Hemiselmis rufescens, Strain PCC563" /LENGTH=180 /DNA_ID=CAMNT_0014427077 /DNA_START=11 /DNA_END=555 /DNA_ORIENTATION=-